ncbi:MAG TPA: ABC transporter substrate-binding protein [Planctomycetota bacterium]|nr:ABC transporter substrate-binding protein [Planctomycetota bacterium]
MTKTLLATVLAFLAACKPENPPPVPTNGAPAAEGSAQENRVAEARKLLAEAGFADGTGFPKTAILYNTSEAHKKIAAAIQSMWKKNLAIEVELTNTEWKTYLDQLSKLDYQVARRGWIGDYNDPNTFLEMFTSHSGNNNTGWKSREFDKLVADANAEQDSAKRRALLEKAEAMLMESCILVPLYFYVSQEMIKPYVRGWHQNLQAIHPLNRVVREDGRTLVIQNHAEIQTLDPGIARGVPEHRVQIALYEGLLNYDPKTTEPIAGVAERWEISSDGKTYTFHLRDNAQWSDGRPVTARDFDFAWKRALAPETASDYAHQLYYLKGAEAYNTGKNKDPNSVQVRATDDRTLVVELEHPTAFFINLMPFFTYYPVRKDKIDEHENQWTMPGKLVTNGPFMLKEWVTNQHLLMVRNPRYWNAAAVKQESVKFLPNENVSTAFDIYEAGECDVITAVPLDFIDKLKARPDYYSDTYLGTYFYSFNVTKPPFDNAKVRKALALALDREIICEKIIRGGQRPAYHFVPPVFSGFRHARFDR